MTSKKPATWVIPLSPGPDDCPQPDRTSTGVEAKRPARTPFRKHPRAMRVELISAIEAVERIDRCFGAPMGWKSLLDAYRSHMASKVTQLIEMVHPTFLAQVEDEVLRSLAVAALGRLDRAFAAIHNYDPRDHFSEGAYRIAQEMNMRMQERGRSQLHMDIEAEAKKLGYFDLPLKSHQRPKVRKMVISKLRLADQWPDASEQSLDDNLARILRKRTSPR